LIAIDDDDGIAAIGDTAVNASTVAIIRNDDVIISTVETSDSSGEDNIMVFMSMRKRRERDGEISGGRICSSCPMYWINPLLCPKKNTLGILDNSGVHLLTINTLLDGKKGVWFRPSAPFAR
jgi:hypothetical protein